MSLIVCLGLGRTHWRPELQTGVCNDTPLLKLSGDVKNARRRLMNLLLDCKGIAEGHGMYGKSSIAIGHSMCPAEGPTACKISM